MFLQRIWESLCCSAINHYGKPLKVLLSQVTPFVWIWGERTNWRLLNSCVLYMYILIVKLVPCLPSKPGERHKSMTIAARFKILTSFRRNKSRPFDWSPYCAFGYDIPYVKIKQTSSTKNAKNHQEDGTELERITFEALGEMRFDEMLFKNIKLADWAWAGTEKSCQRGVGVSAKVETH